MTRHLARGLAVLILALLALGVLVWALGVRDGAGSAAPPAASAAAGGLVARGAYLARAGNCQACHTARGEAAYAGGRAIDTPFGTVYTSNLTPDRDSGLGAWSAADFWRALHHGRSRDGRLLLPAFPYTSYTQVTRADADALFAYLQSLPPAARPNRPHALRWPYSTQWALAAWRALYFQPAAFAPQPDRSAAWNRGAYLVRGLGHCNACHAARNALGASGDALDLAGGQVPMQGWYAPSLLRASEAGVTDWPPSQVVQLLQTGVSARGSALGPMAEVVLHSTQHLSPEDLHAMATYLRDLPGRGGPVDVDPPGPAPAPAKAAAGALLYKTHCADCHGETGEGAGGGAYPALAGNRAVRMADAGNLVQVVLRGGFAPATAGNPRPFGMPPFQIVLNDAEVAAVLSHIRHAWGHQAGEVTEIDVNRYRAQEAR